MGPAVEDLGDRLEGLLPCRVPDLQLEDGLLHLDEQGAELYAHRDLVVLAELVGRHSVHEAGLPHARVPNDDQLEEVVLVQTGVALVGQDLVRDSLQLPEVFVRERFLCLTAERLRACL